MTNLTLPFEFPVAPADILRRRAMILAELLAQDEAFCRIPVQSISALTPARMLRLYDNAFFSGALQRSYDELKVSLSSRLISAAGKFMYTRSGILRSRRAEIRMSSDFLFRLTDGPFSLNGLSAATPQEAFLLVFEHELCHVAEYALFASTGHSKRFLALANGLFGHTKAHHSLPTRAQEAAQNGFRVGDSVAFLHEGCMCCGVITYIGKTATVMVRSAAGEYKDALGRRYTKYRVPLNMLRHG